MSATAEQTNRANRVRTVSRGQLQRRVGKKWSQHPGDVLPASLAEMDFHPMPAIVSAIQEALAIGDLGYPPQAERSGVPEAFSAWAARRWGWDIDPRTVQFAPDVVAGLENCIDALTTPGDAIAVQTPAYPPFLTAILQANRNLVTIPLTQGEIDFDELEARLRLSRARVFILCNPHNPTGRVFSRAELGQLAAITARHQVLVVSDEIHGDLVYPGHEFVPFASLGAEVGKRTITLTSASKTFNIAGLRLALCIVADRHLRERLLALPQSRWSVYGVLGVRATLAAWSCAGAKWHASLLSHLQRLRSLSERLVSRHLPEVGYRAPQASYLAWLDFRAMQLPQEPAEFFLREAKVALSAGLDFGSEGSGRARLNFATSESLLGEIFGRLAQASERRSVVPSSIASPE